MYILNSGNHLKNKKQDIKLPNFCQRSIPTQMKQKSVRQINN